MTTTATKSNDSSASNLKAITPASAKIGGALEGFASTFVALPQSHFTGTPALAEARRAAFARFQKLGLPSIANEEWRFTSLKPLERVRFGAAPRNAEAIHSEFHAYASLAPSRLVFVNGLFRPNLSTVEGLPAGVRVGSLADALKGTPALAAQIGTVATAETMPFLDLNTAFFEDGFFVYVPKGIVVEQPIAAIYLTSSMNQPSAVYPRNLVIAEENSQIRLLEIYAGFEGEVYLTNSATEFRVAADAVVDHYRVQEEATSAFHISSIDSHIGRAGNFSTQTFTFGGGLTRNDIGCTLAGEGGVATMNGLVRIAGRQLCDNHTRIDHAVPHCDSHEFYKAILDEQSRGVFNGKILVREDAQKTNALQTNKNLLLSKEALINTNPQLEIFADDVKCTHGATIGQLEEKYVYYLRSRGIPEIEARNLLIFAFANEIVQRVKIDSVRQRLEKRLLDVQAEAERRRSIAAMGK